MENVMDFFYAALPWLAMGLLLAIFFVRSEHRKNMKTGKRQLRTTEQRECAWVCVSARQLDRLSALTQVWVYHWGC